MGAEGVPGFHARLLPCSGADSEYTPFAGIRVSLLSFPGHTDVALVSWLCFCHGIDAAAVYCMAGEFVCPDPTLDDGGWPYRNARRFGSVSRIADAIAISVGVVSRPLRRSLHNSAGDRFACLLRSFSRRFAERPAALDLSRAGCDFVSGCVVLGCGAADDAGVARCFVLHSDGRTDFLGLL